MTAACIVSVGNPTGSGTGPGAPVALAQLLPSESPLYVGDTVTVVDKSTGTPTSWNWYINGSLVSQERNFSFYCNAPGGFSVSLTVANSFGSNTRIVGGFAVLLRQ